MAKSKGNAADISEAEELIEITESYSPGKQRMLRGENIEKNDEEKPPSTKSGVHQANNRG